MSEGVPEDTHTMVAKGQLAATPSQPEGQRYTGKKPHRSAVPNNLYHAAKKSKLITLESGVEKPAH